MININRVPDFTDVKCEEGFASDAKVRFEVKCDRVEAYLKAPEGRPMLISLRWNNRFDGDVRILGDAWERSYGDLGFSGLSSERHMPWYFAVSHGGGTDCVGVGVRPNAFVCWYADCGGITAICDVRCGTKGVLLGERELHIATFMSREYPSDVDNTFEALCDFCSRMSPEPVLPSEAVYGGNNWYYAYGNSSYEEILSDAAFQAELSCGLPNRPFMVIDDGWSPNRTCGPWVPNERFRDMKALADDIKGLGVRPGIWFRPLFDKDVSIAPESRFAHSPALDPSRPEVIEHIKNTVNRIVFDWGYELIKHDFSAFDTFGGWGFQRNKYFTDGDWSFSDRTRTGAEIYKDLCRAIFEATGGKAYVIACNCVSHLVAGYCHINRTGDDTSGYAYDRTRRIGVNTLAFRLSQNGRFYMIDADCAGFIKGYIPFEANKLWVDLLANSGSPFFISAPAGSFDGEQLAFMKASYKLASEQKQHLKPLDWKYNATPCLWEIDGELREYDWFLGGKMRIPFDRSKE